MMTRLQSMAGRIASFVSQDSALDSSLPPPLLTRGWFAILMALVAARLALVKGLGVCAVGASPHDDALFVRLAESISRGEWLGAYDRMTLIKGPLYSLFIAGSHALGVPLQMAQQFLYLGFCVVLLFAVRPLFRNSWALLGMTAVVMFNPLSFGVGQMASVIREGIYPAVTGLTLACAMGLLLRAGAPGHQALYWALGLGVSAGAFWLTREEGLWVVPSLILLLGFAAVVASTVRRRFARLITVVGVPVIVSGLIVAAVCLENKIHYGLFTTVEFKRREFVGAYGALARVKPAPVISRIVVSRRRGNGCMR